MKIGQRELRYVAEAFIEMFGDVAADRALQHASLYEERADKDGRHFWHSVAATISHVSEQPTR